MLNVEMEGSLANVTVPCKWGYDYDKTVSRASIISEWNLVCGRGYLVELVQMTFMFGVFLGESTYHNCCCSSINFDSISPGNILGGMAADKYGRKNTLLLCIVFQSFFGLASAWSPWYAVFLICRFISGVANGGTVIVSFVLCLEVVGGRWRSIIPILYQIPFGVGYSLMAAFAFFVRSWRELQWVLSVLSATYVFYYWCVAGVSEAWKIVKLFCAFSGSCSSHRDG